MAKRPVPLMFFSDPAKPADPKPKQPAVKAGGVQALVAAFEPAEKYIFAEVAGTPGQVEIHREPILMPDGQRSGYEHVDCLSWQNDGGRWCLRIESGPEDGERDRWSSRQIEQVPVYLKKLAARNLQNLLETLRTNRARERAEIDEITASVLAFSRGEQESLERLEKDAAQIFAASSRTPEGR